MQLNPYLHFDGQCAWAFRFYAEVLGGTITFMQTFGESPMAEQYPGLRDRIAHATLEVNGQLLMGCDVPGERYERPRGFSVSLQLTAAEADGIFPALADGGTVVMPLQQTYWSRRFGMVVDRFGTPWIVNGGEQA